MIRKFETQDLDAVMQIWLHANLNAHAFIPASFWEAHFEMVRDRLPQAELYVHENDALRQIDVAPNVQAQREIIDWLKDVYAQRGGGILVGLFGHCYLGPPYVDHAFDLTGAIREHYTASDTVPTMYQSARSLAVSDAYAFIEIYADGHVVPIRPDGTPAF